MGEKLDEGNRTKCIVKNDKVDEAMVVETMEETFASHEEAMIVAKTLRGKMGIIDDGCDRISVKDNKVFLAFSATDKKKMSKIKNSFVEALRNMREVFEELKY